MFERYTEDARRVIFFGRYEASNLGCPYIEAEHLLLGLVREQRRMVQGLLPALPDLSELHAEIAARSPGKQKISTSVDLPLSNESKKILAYAAEEAEHVQDHFIRCQHLLLGMVREDTCFAAELLKRYGAELESLRREIADAAPKRIPGSEARTMYCPECNRYRAPLICKHCSVEICLKCGTPLLNQRP